MYQIRINQTRYGGTYEGGSWYALSGDFVFTREYMDYLDGDDCDAVDFWLSQQAEQIGIGDDPNSALLDLLRKIAPESIPTFLG